MIRLEAVALDGVKSVRGAMLSVPPLLAVQGPNGAGKSSLLQAIRLAVLGYEPTVGKTLPATRQLAGADEMKVALTFSTGFGVDRSFGKSIRTGVVPPQGERTEAQAQERINAETGAFLPSFDIAAFLALSAEKRRAALFTLLPRELAHLDEEIWRQCLGYAEEEDVVKRTIDRLWLESVIVASSPIEGLSSALEVIHTRFNTAEQQRRDQQKIAARAREQASGAEHATQDEPGAELERLQGELAAAQARHATLKAQHEDAERVRRRGEERDERLAMAGRLIADLDRQIAEKEQTLQAAEGVGDPDQQAIASARAEVQRLEAEIAAANDQHRREREAASTAAERLRAEARVAAAEKAKHQTALAAMQSDERCPICGSQAEFEAAKATIAQRLADAETAHAAAEEAARLGVEAARSAGHATSERMLALGEQIKAARVTLEARLSAARMQEHLVGMRGELDTLRAKRAGHADLRARLVEEEIGEAPPSDEAELSAAGRLLVDLREAVSAEQRRLEARGRARGLAEAARAAADREEAEADRFTRRADALKRLLGALKRLRGQVIEGMVAPVETTANELLRTIDPAKTFRFIFEREERDTFDFGFEEGGVFRGYDTASTGEDAFLAVVFIAALIAAVRPPWPVLLLDNAEAVDDLRGRRTQLMRALATLTDRIGNVILVGCCEFAPSEGWTILHAEGGRYFGSDAEAGGDAVPAVPLPRLHLVRADG